MTLTLQKVSAAAAILVLSLLASILFLGNQRQALALTVTPAASPASPSTPPAGLGGLIVCKVFTDLNEHGSPIPVMNGGDCHNPPDAPPQCSDGIDNDGNGQKDFPADTGCSSSSDNNEFTTPPPPAPLSACSNDADDDGDGFTDENDPNCHTDGNPSNSSSYDSGDDTETGPLPACWNGLDDDGDGLKDFPADLGCSSALDGNETNSSSGGQAQLVVVKIVVNDNNGTSTVSNFALFIGTTTSATTTVISGATTTVATGTWTVREVQNAGYTATFSGDCTASGTVTLAAGETKTCRITNNDVVGAPASTAAPSACADGIDNDGDNLVDMADSGCNDSSDTDEANAPARSGDGGGSPSGDSGGGGGGGGGSGEGIGAGFVAFSVSPATPTVLGVSADAPPVAANESCDKYLTAFIKSGAKNNENQVRRLQYVLRDFEGATITMNGVYDAATLAAVHAFQSKYAGDILTPWGITKSTGFTYLTTRKKINEVYCRSTKQFPLTYAEQQTINTSRAGVIAAPGLKKPVSAKAAPKSAPAPAAQETKKSLWGRVLDVVKGVGNSSGSLWGSAVNP